MEASLLESERIASLARYDVLDTPPEPALDQITSLASQLFDVPMCLVTFADEHRLWVKSGIGLDASELLREETICTRVVLRNGPLVLEDALADPDFGDHPFVTGEPRIRFYAGVPVRCPDGHCLGVLCIADRSPRAFSARDREILAALAGQVERELELRLERDGYQAVFAHNPGPMWICDAASGAVLDVNEAAGATYGYARADVLGTTIDRLSHPDDLPLFRSALQGGDGDGPVVRCRTSDGRLLYAQVTTSPIRWHGRPASLVRALDVTDQVRAQAEERRLTAMLEHERKRLRQVFDNAPTFIAILTGPEHRFEMANPACAGLVGPRELLGRPLAEALPEVAGQGLLALLDEVLGTGTPYVGREFPVLLQRTEGAPPERRYVNFVFEPLPGPDGTPGGIFVHGVDVTVDVEAREEAERSHREKQRVMDRSLDLICTIDRSGRFVQVNAASERILGYAPEEVVGRTYLDLIDEADRERTIEATAQIVSGVSVDGFHNRYVHRDGSLVDITWSANFDEEEGLAYCVGRDVTELRRHQEQREATEAALRRSEAKFRGLVQNSSEVVTLLGVDGVLEYQSPSIQRLLGYEPRALEGRNVFELIHPEDREDVAAAIERLTQGARSVTATFRFLHEDGSWRILESTATNALDDEAISAIVACSRDITDRLRAEEAVRESEAFLASIIENLPVSVFVKTADELRFVRMNRTCEELFGVTREEVVGRTDYDYYRPELAAAYQADDRRALASETVITVPEECYESPTRGRRVMRTKKMAIRDASGRAKYLLGIAEDVTELKQYERELVEAKERAEQMARLKSSLLANMSHEIRTPLTAILGFAEVLREQCQGEHSELVQMIYEGGERLLETLNSVLDLAQLESGLLHLSTTRLDAGELIDGTIHLFLPQAASKGIDLRIERPAERLWLDADRGALGRVLNNLVSNAVKFTEAGAITVSYGTEEGRAYLRVADSGIGIGGAFLPHLFEEFRQESTGHGRTYEGTGLGLTITKRLVELMAGTIEVQSEKGRGSTFTVWLPHRAQAMPRDGGTAGAPGSGAGRRGRLLVVEDQEQAQVLVRLLFRDHFDVVSARTADEALGLVRDGDFEGALVDINLGGELTGLDVLRGLRAAPGGASIPVVACTAYALPGDRERFLAAGFDGYVGKPFRKREILEAFSKAGAEG